MAETTVPPDLKNFLASVRLTTVPADPKPMVSSNLDQVVEDVSQEERFISSMAAVAYNMQPEKGTFDKKSIQDLVGLIDALVQDQLNAIMHTEAFQKLESTWLSIDDLVKNTNFRANITLSLLDVGKDEAQ